MDFSINSFYVGEYVRQFDEKMRVALPSKWRSGNENETFLALPNPIGCITIYPPKMVSRLEEKVAQISFGDTKGQMALAKLFSKADTFSCDSKGRIKLEDRLMKFSGITTEAVFVGGGSVFNIWEPERFRVYVEADTVGDLSSILKGLGL